MKRSGLTVMARLVGLVKPLAGYMILAVTMGLVGHLCAAFITVFGGFALLNLLGLEQGMGLTAVFLCLMGFALARGFLRYAEQNCNHFIAFKLLALIRDKVFSALRRLCPAKLDGRDKGDLISVITSDIELLEVFYAPTVPRPRLTEPANKYTIFFRFMFSPVVRWFAYLFVTGAVN